MVIKNVLSVLPKKTLQASVFIEKGKIKDIKQCSGPKSEYILAPGVIDLHTHGSGGYDYMDGRSEDIALAAKSAMKHGVTSILPTSLTASDEDIFLFLDNFKKLDRTGLPHMIGVHLEGPYLSRNQIGAQNSRFLQTPTKKHYIKILEKAQGTIKRWTLAPELPGAMEMLDDLKDSGIIFSAGHTDATYDVISQAYDKGLRLLTHFYSGMSSITRKSGFRVLGAIESGYLIDDLYVELICDGIHLPPELLKLILKCKRNDRIISCTDSMRNAGMGDGYSVLGPKKDGLKTIVEDGVAKLLDRSCFAGSVATGEILIQTLYKLGLKLEEVFRYVSLQPAILAGIDKETGSIEKGKNADLIVLNKDLKVEKVYINGQQTIGRNENEHQHKYSPVS